MYSQVYYPSFCTVGGGVVGYITHASGHTVGVPPGHTLPPSGHNLPPSGHNLPPCYWHLVVATKTCLAGRRATRILLECCLVFNIFTSATV